MCIGMEVEIHTAAFEGLAQPPMLEIDVIKKYFT